MGLFDVKAVFTEGDTLADYNTIIKDPSNDNAVVNLTGFVSVELQPVDKRAGNTVSAITATINDAAAGDVTFDCTTIVSTGVGTYDCQEIITDGTPEVQRGARYRIVVIPKVES
jgi:hypothetical protein